MRQIFNQFLDRMSEYLAHRKGLLPAVGLFMVSINWLLQYTATGWLVESNFLLHLGVILALLGILLSWAL